MPVWAALLLPAIALLPLASPWASYILAPVFALAAGLRLARLRWRSSTIDSTTWEEAPLRAGVWLRQRARWFKGFAVTAIVHARTPRQTMRELGPAGCIALLAQLPVSLLCTGAHPVGVGLALGGDLSGPLAALLLLGYATAVALHAAAALRARLPVWLALPLPFYWALHWAALLLALSDLVRDPSHWRKTNHGAAVRVPTGATVADLIPSPARETQQI
ncbi:hypothetical protein [Gemmobacter aquatilis]|nr:hypothetical protein [Gemmobacter aquatilis]